MSQQTLDSLMTIEATASGGLALARCPGLVMSLRPPCLAAPGAGQVAAQVAAEQKFVAAREALRVARCRARAHTRCARATWSRQSRACEAPRTLDLGGVALRRGAARRMRAPRRSPRRAPAGAYEAAHAAALTAMEGVESAACRAMVLEPDYELVHIVARLAPSFGRTRGQLRGAAGALIEWPASRTRASLVEAEEAEATARCAWRASEWSLGVMACECGQVELHTRGVQVELARLQGMRAADAAASCGLASSPEERTRAGVVDAVQQMAAASAATLAHVKEVLDRFYWGVWGSARRIKASAREVSVLTASLREAEWGAGDDDLPGGSTWLAAFGVLAGEAGDRVGGGGVAVGEVAVGGDDGGGDCAGGGASCCGAHSGTTEEGRQAAGGGCATGLWRGRMRGSPRGQGPGPTTGSHEDAWRCWAAAWLRAVGEQNRRQGQQEGDGIGAAMCCHASVRERLWLARKHRRWRRLRSSWS
jgi:hypothetical protein